MITAITLRPWSSADVNSLVKYANNPSIAKNMTDQFPNPYTEDKAKLLIENASRNKPCNILAIDFEGEAIGGIGIHPQTDIHCKNAELGYWLAESFWGKGIITKAISQMTKYAFANFDLHRIFARPFASNIASQKALQKAGFTLEATFEKTIFKNNEFIDELIYAIRKK